jgi:putative ABC transport system permease protein
MSIAWRKVWRDLWSDKLRTLLVVLATTVGVFALGMVFGLSGVMRAQMTESHRASNAPHLEFYTSLVDQEVVEAVMRDPQVAAAEGETRSFGFRWKLEGETDWRDGAIFSRADYGDQRMYPIELLDGHWPRKRELAVERMSSDYFDLPIGETIVVEVGQREYRLPIAGVVRHPYTPPPQIGFGDATFCADEKTLAWVLGQEEGFDTINVQLESFSQEAAEEAGERIKERLETMGVGVGYWDVVAPDVHWGQDMMDTIFVILGVLGSLSLALSGFLVINVLNAIIVQQVWQIGVMKVVGATFGRVVRVYLATATIYGLLSLLVAVPVGAVAAHLMAVWFLDMFNIIFDDFRVMPVAVALQVVMGLAVPLLAALVPVIGGARTTAHKAISSHGLGGKFGRGWLDRLLGHVRSLPRPMVLSLRNTFRRKARVSLTLLALTLGGVMFIMVLSASASFTNTIDILLSDFGFDVLVAFDRLHRVARLVEVSESVAGVSRAEVWNRWDAQLALPNGEELGVGVWGVPDDSKMFNPRIVGGRILYPDDGRAILLNNKIAEDEGFRVGDVITLTINARESTWTVVGLILNINNDFHDNFVPFDVLAQETGYGDRGGLAMVTFGQQDPDTHKRLIDELRDTYEARHVEAVYFESAAKMREQNLQSFSVITYLMLSMAILAGLVGGAGLMSTMSINVVERGREIGVMRSLGATSLTIVAIFVVEGVLIGVLSWLLAVPLSYPGARLFSHVVGVNLIELPLDFSYPVDGMVLWLAVMIVLSALASMWPAYRAAQVSVRESLAYE